jgi:hypothetical protein
MLPESKSNQAEPSLTALPPLSIPADQLPLVAEAAGPEPWTIPSKSPIVAEPEASVHVFPAPSSPVKDYTQRDELFAGTAGTDYTNDLLFTADDQGYDAFDAALFNMSAGEETMSPGTQVEYKDGVISVDSDAIEDKTVEDKAPNLPQEYKAILSKGIRGVKTRSGFVTGTRLAVRKSTRQHLPRKRN